MKRMFLVHATTKTRSGGLHSDIAVCCCTETELERILKLLQYKRTLWERSGQQEPSWFWASEVPISAEITLQSALALNRRFEQLVLRLKGVGRKTLSGLWDENN